MSTLTTGSNGSTGYTGAYMGMGDYTGYTGGYTGGYTNGYMSGYTGYTGTGSSLGDLENRLLFTSIYDALFNYMYVNENQLESKMKTQQELIQTYQEDTFQREKLNAILKIFVISLFIIMMIVLLYRLSVIPTGMITLYIIVGILVATSFFVYMVYYSYNYQAYIDKRSRQTYDNLEKTDERAMGSELDCEPNEETGDFDSIKNPYLGQTEENPVVLNGKANTSYNVWEKGSIREKNASDYAFDAPPNTPVQEYDAVPGAGSTIYYDCVYNGTSPRVNGLVMEKEYLKSTIPCDYYIDYKETGTYVKDKDGKYIAL